MFCLRPRRFVITSLLGQFFSNTHTIVLLLKRVIPVYLTLVLGILLVFAISRLWGNATQSLTALAFLNKTFVEHARTERFVLLSTLL